jgi:hypothetical protein
MSKADGERFKYRDGHRGKVNSDIAGDALEEIHGRCGALTAAVVVDESRPDDAPLHPEFEWDDFKAAEQWRRKQASTVIRSVVVLETATEPQRQVYTLTRRESAPAPTYEKTSVVVLDEKMLRESMRFLTEKYAAAKAAMDELAREAKASGIDGERMSRIVLAQQAFVAASAAVSALH